MFKRCLIGRCPVVVWMLVVGGLLAVPGCDSTQTVDTPAVPVGPAFTGPQHLRGTVGSMARLRGHQPLLVSGYGLVVGLDQTGSSEVPAELRQWLLQELRRGGFGSARLGTLAMSPERVLADDRTAVVSIEGLIPPGAVTGTRFDLLVRAVDSQTTSLAGGTLYTFPLAVGGLQNPQRFLSPLARAGGRVYLQPSSAGGPTAVPGELPLPGAAAVDDDDFQRSGVVLGGGRVTEPRTLELVLNQPSFRRAREIADRINERLPTSPEENYQTAEAESDLIIRLRVPRAFAQQPAELLGLIDHLFVRRGQNFEPQQARRMMDHLAQSPGDAESVRWSLQALGPNTIPVLRDFYDHDELPLRLTALRAGAYLEDERSSVHLRELATHDDPAVRLRVAQALVHLPRSLQGHRALTRLLSDPHEGVRINAYETLFLNSDPIIDRLTVSGGRDIKFIIDRVPAEQPLLYVTQTQVPRVVLFGPEQGFNEPMRASVWNNRLMMRTAPLQPAPPDAPDAADANAVAAAPDAPPADDGLPDRQLDIYYQPRGEIEGRVLHTVPNVATMLYALAHRPNMTDPQDGLDLTYSQVVDVLHHLHQQGALEAPARFHVSPLARLIASERAQERAAPRPEDGEL
jgi:hypothetical protein